MGTDAGAWRENRATRSDQGSHIRGVPGCNENAGWKGKRLSIPPGFQLGGMLSRGSGDGCAVGPLSNSFLFPGALESSEGGERAGPAI